MNSNTEEIKARVNIVDFIGGYVRLQKAGSSWKACCPFHGEKTPSFVVNDEKQFWHCFGCGKGGDIFTFLMEMEGLEFREALKILAERAGVEISQYNAQAEKEKNRGMEILELTSKFYQKQLWDGMGKEKILNYLFERGLQEKTINDFRLGYAPGGWSNLTDFLLGRGFSMEEISRTGVVVERQNENNAHRSYDRFRNRIMFPIADSMGRIVGFTARVAPGEDESQAKYVNTPETDFYHKSRILYGIDKAKNAIKKMDQVVLVEGNMDVIASFQAGIENVIAVSGTALTQQQIETIKRYTKNLCLFFDADSAGRQAIIRSCEMAFANDLNVSIITPKEGKDAADVVKKDSEELKRLVKEAIGAMEYFLQNLFSQYDSNNIAEKKKIVDESVALISNFPKEIDKQHWGKVLAQRLNIDEKIIYNEISDKIVGKNQYPRREEPEGNEKKLPFQAKKRSDIISEKILFLFLKNDDVWRKAEEEYHNEIEEYLGKNNFLSSVLAIGKKNDFKFDRFELSIKDEEMREFLRKLKFSGEAGIENEEKSKEQAFENDWKYFQQLMEELGREKKKEKIDFLARKIATAEKNGSKDEVKKLTQEFSDLFKDTH
ncbi:MAG: DNA primase [Candidatus Moranbacteria bacterium]|jgi:DNA primase|nr:DNA primase [Candidatus Moranbacteria bacterium]